MPSITSTTQWFIDDHEINYEPSAVADPVIVTEHDGKRSIWYITEDTEGFSIIQEKYIPAFRDLIETNVRDSYSAAGEARAALGELAVPEFIEVSSHTFTPIASVWAEDGTWRMSLAWEDSQSESVGLDGMPVEASAAAGAKQASEALDRYLSSQETTVILGPVVGLSLEDDA